MKLQKAKPKHTPGPWAALETKPVEFNAQFDINRVIHIGRDIGDGNGHEILAVTDNERDAALIAAAPEMLEALESLYKLTQIVMESIGSRDCSIRLQAREAIAKARGERDGSE